MGITTFGDPHDTGRAGKRSARSTRSYAMLAEEIEDHCSTAVLMRARGIAMRAKTLMTDLTCEPDSDDSGMTLHGRIRGTTSPQSVYRTWVRFDVEREEYDDGGCTCPAYTGYRYDVCKHMAALVLRFCQFPETFGGFSKTSSARSSHGLMDFMEHLDDMDAQRRQQRRAAAQGMQPAAAHTATFGSPARRGAEAAGLSSEPGPGQVTLEPVLARTHGRDAWSVSFRIGSKANGASYVLKSISRFVLDMRLGTFDQYGQKLAFTHTPDMLDDHARRILRFMQRAIATRDTVLRASRYAAAPMIERDLALAGDELAQLLRLSEGRDIGVVLGGWGGSRPSSVPVVGEDCPIRIAMTRSTLGRTAGYALRGNVTIDALIDGADRTYALIGIAPGWHAARDRQRANAAASASKGRGGANGANGANGTNDGAFLDSAEAVRMLSHMNAEQIAAMTADDFERLGLLGDADAGAGSTGSAVGAGGKTDAEDADGTPASLAQQIEDADRTRNQRSIFKADARWFCRLPKACEPIADVIESLCDGDDRGQFLADADMPLFARTMLPLLQQAGLDGDVPSDIRQMQPQPCEPEYYLDRDDNGVTCALKARYGAREVGIIPLAPGTRSGARDLAEERDATHVMQRYFSIVDDRHPAFIDRDDTHALVRLFDDGLAALRASGKVFTTPAFDRLLAPKPPSMRLKAVMNGGLVDVSVLADEVPADEVSAVLASYRRRQRFHRLKDGTLVPLGERNASIDALADAARDLGLDADAFDSGDGHVQVPGFQAFLVDDVVADADKDDSFTRYVNDLKVIDPSRYAVPDALAGVLRPYQATGYRWLQTLWDKGFGGILADEMGLGKSVQFIALLLARHACGQVGASGAGEASAGPALIVCPASLVYNWAAEFAKFAPSLDVRTVAGAKASRRALLASLDGDAPETGGDATKQDGGMPDVLITSYDLLRLDIDEYRKHAFSAMALDEAQVIKNHTTKVAKAVKAVSAQHRFALTGTPVENRLAELWSIFDYLMPGLLGGFKRFHERYELPISSDAYGDEGRAQAAKLKALVGMFILRRLKSQVLTDLPDKLENVVTVQLEGEQRRLYAAHEQRLKATLTHTDAKDFNAERIRILAELTKLRQLCCDPRLLYANARNRSAKLAAIEQLVQTCIDEGRKALVFSQFTSFLDLIGERLKDCGIDYYTITGATPKKRRVELVDRFNGDDVPVFLISLKAGNTGLNLVGASVVIHADPWWNAAAQDQATDRAHRIGQTRDVDVYQIVAKDTIEERMLKLQRAKSEIARQVVGGGAAGAGSGAGGAAGAAAAGAGAGVTGIASLTKSELLGLLTA